MERGGGLALFLSAQHAHIGGNLFAGNTAVSGHGSGLIVMFGPAILVHNTFAGPSINAGSAIESLGSSLGVTNTIIASDTVGISATAGTAVEDYNLFFANGNNRVGVAPGAHSLTGNPYFANPTGGDYRR